jgi:pimeloyl-ACP methyl ester carboxylesterase
VDHSGRRDTRGRGFLRGDPRGPTTSVGIEISYSSLAEQTSTALSEIVKQLPSYTGPHGFDPVPTLRQLRIPTLWLYGAEDRSIPTGLCVEIQEALRRENAPPLRG